MVQCRKSINIIGQGMGRGDLQEMNTFSKNAAKAFVKIQYSFLMDGILQNGNEWRENYKIGMCGCFLTNIKTYMSQPNPSTFLI